MYFRKTLRMFFIINIVFGLFGAIVANRTIIDNMSLQEIIDFFGSPNGIVPLFKLIIFDVPLRTKRSTQWTLNLDFNGIKLSSTFDLITDPYLLGRNTAIWGGSTDQNAFKSVKFFPDPKILERIGDFDFYQDIHKGSALTYFHRSQNFTGVVCQNYAIKAVPASWTKGVIHPLPGHAVKMRSVGLEEDIPRDSDEPRTLHVIFKIPEVSQEKFLRVHRRRKPIHNPLAQSRNERQVGRSPPNVVYPRIILTMDYGSIKGFLVDDIVVYLIAFLNGVDMLYRQLNNPAVRLSIVGIIIPKDGTATPFIAPDTSSMFNLNADYVLNKTGLDFYDDYERFPIDSYDIIMTITRKPLGRYDKTGTWEPLGGLAITSSACSKSQWFYGNTNAIGGVGISQFDWIFGGTAIMAHELGHVLGAADHDGSGTSSSCSGTDGYEMTPSANYAMSLAWSSCSKQAFRNYLSSPAASCLITPPKSIKPALQHMEGAWLSINGHCKNYLSYSGAACNLSNVRDICYRFGCMVNQRCVDTTLRPYDGSPCGNGKHCQNLQCSWIP